ncbi:MAG TPA: 4Fe-4S dicluster domain-containing protein [Euryarchaeota archaeon]|nr:MAG: hypothetical protein C0180_00210 [Aciduliprofundum sp.]HEU13007.1 4Fe-4S dicluster domain-containing protein [Euryarchaeota archaeon]
MIYKIKKDLLKKYIDGLLEKYEVWGPKKIGNDTVFSKLKSGEEFIDARTLLGPKESIYPIKEKIGEMESKEIIVMGIKSCDLRAYRMLDDVLGIDEFYSSRRRNVHFLNFVCTEPCEYGFCSTFFGPRLDEYEMQFTDIGEYYIVESKNDKLIGRDFENATEDDLKILESKMRDFYNKMPPMNIENLHKKISWDDPRYREFSKRCISCGACNFACPTCFCFDTYDDDGLYREWDSCILSGFTRMAGNVNPRNTLDLRLRQRFMHKLRYHYENFSYYLCTGCGRCIEVCPVRIDIRDFIRGVGP